MMSGKRSYKLEQQSLRSLLKEIDAEVDDYIRRINNPSGRYLASTLALTSLLKELEKHHPLSMATRRHGQKLLDRVKAACGQRRNWEKDSWLESDIRQAFALPYRHSLTGSTRRDLLRIAKSFASPFIAIEEKIEALYAMFGEMKRRGKHQ